eukprot:SAG22_NODE_46_length_24705_cov_89.861010_2_plen_160_part_00
MPALDPLITVTVVTSQPAEIEPALLNLGGILGLGCLRRPPSAPHRTLDDKRWVDLPWSETAGRRAVGNASKGSSVGLGGGGRGGREARARRGAGGGHQLERKSVNASSRAGPARAQGRGCQGAGRKRSVRGRGGWRCSGPHLSRPGSHHLPSPSGPHLS